MLRNRETRAFYDANTFHRTAALSGQGAAVKRLRVGLVRASVVDAAAVGLREYQQHMALKHR
jgi:hypothetical protein